MPVKIPLNDAAGRIRNPRHTRGRIGQHHDHRGGETDQSERAQPNGLSVKIAIKPDRTARKRCDAEAKRDLWPVKHAANLHIGNQQ